MLDLTVWESEVYISLGHKKKCTVSLRPSLIKKNTNILVVTVLWLRPRMSPQTATGVYLLTTGC